MPKREAKERLAAPARRSSPLIDTRVIYCGDRSEPQAPARGFFSCQVSEPQAPARGFLRRDVSVPQAPARGFLAHFEDRHASTQAYIEYMRPRCVELARVLKKTGSFYYPCDWHASGTYKVASYASMSRQP